MRSISDEAYTVQIEPDDSDSYEINNTFTNAAEISLNTDISAKFEDEGDVDFYKFIISES